MKRIAALAAVVAVTLAAPGTADAKKPPKPKKPKKNECVLDTTDNATGLPIYWLWVPPGCTLADLP